MLAIAKIENRKTAANKKAIKEVQAIMRAQFSGDKAFIDNFPMSAFGGPKLGFRYSLYVGRDPAASLPSTLLGTGGTGQDGIIRGFIIYSYFARLNFYYLDYMAAAPGFTGKGIGRELYEFLRAKAKEKAARGIFFECLSDDPDEVKDGAILGQNIARLKFYARWGARPLANNLYHEKVKATSNATWLVFDPLDTPVAISRYETRKIVKRIIQKKYSDYCPPEYIKRVVLSFKDDPVKLREI